MTIDDPKDLVRRGYDALSWHYRSDDADDGTYGPWLAMLRERLPAGAGVLDLGCGCGIPVARSLASAGYAVTGVDVSQVQIERARRLVPTARFLHADAAQITFPASAFDAVVCLYVLFHLPLDEQPVLLGRIAGWLRPGGWLLATTAQRAWTGTEAGWLGGPAPMWWSHAGAATYRDWIHRAGLDLAAEELVPDGYGAGFHPAAGLADAMKDVPCIVFALAIQNGPADSVVPAVQNLMLAARAIGIGSVPTTLHPTVMDRFRAMFDIPSDVAFHFCVPLGYPQGRFGSNVRKRQPATVIVTQDSSPQVLPGPARKIFCHRTAK